MERERTKLCEEVRQGTKFIVVGKKDDPDVVNKALCVVLCQANASHAAIDKFRVKAKTLDKPHFWLATPQKVNQAVKWFEQNEQVQAKEEEMTDAADANASEPTKAISGREIKEEKREIEGKGDKTDKLKHDFTSLDKETTELLLIDLGDLFKQKEGEIIKRNDLGRLLREAGIKRTASRYLVQMDYLVGIKKEERVFAYRPGQKLLPFIEAEKDKGKETVLTPAAEIRPLEAFKKEVKQRSPQVLIELGEKIAELRRQVAALLKEIDKLTKQKVAIECLLDNSD